MPNIVIGRPLRPKVVVRRPDQNQASLAGMERCAEMTDPAPARVVETGERWMIAVGRLVDPLRLTAKRALVRRDV